MLDVTVEHATMVATFGGEGLATADTCAELVARIERDQPRCVRLACDLAFPGAHWSQALAGRQLPSLSAFIFDTDFQTQTRQRDNAIGDLRAILIACPNLEQLFATGALELSATEHEALRHLHLLGDPLTPALLSGLGASSFPHLEVIALSLASDAGPGPTEVALAALTSLRAPALRELHLAGVESVEAALTTIVPKLSGRAKQLSVHAPIDDEDQLLELIEEYASVLGAFTSVALPFADFVSTAAYDRARELVPIMRDTDDLPSATLPAAYKRWPS